MEISTDFECGNGKNIKQVSETEFVMETEGSDPSYSFYFYFKIKGDKDGKNVKITVWPDSEFSKDNPELFNDDLPSVLWIRRNDDFGWTRMNQHWSFIGPDTYEVQKSHYLIKLHIEPHAEIEVSNMLPLPYSEMNEYLRNVAALKTDMAQIQEVGKSEQDRSIIGLIINDREITSGSRKRILAYAGEHAVEFAGQWALKGMIEFLTSNVSEAKDIRKKYQFLFIPQVNPDGNVLGLLHNANRVNLHLDYNNEDGVCTPKSQEARVMWQLVESYRPDVFLCVHTFIGPLLSSDPPYEGLVVPPTSCFKDSEWGKTQELINEYLSWYTDATYFWGRDQLLKTASENTATYQFAAQYGAVGCLFEPNMSVGERGCIQSALKVLRALLRGVEDKAID